MEGGRRRTSNILLPPNYPFLFSEQNDVFQVEIGADRILTTTISILKYLSKGLTFRLPPHDSFSVNIPNIIHFAGSILLLSLRYPKYRKSISGNEYWRFADEKINFVQVSELTVLFEDVTTNENINVSFLKDQLTQSISISILTGSGMAYFLQTEREGDCNKDNPMRCTVSTLITDTYIL